MSSTGQLTGTVFRIARFAIHDGPGIRTTVFLKGCPLRCAWCHSPESQSSKPEFMPLPDRCIECGSCVAACPEHAIAAPGAATRTDLCRLCRTCVDVCPTGARVLAGDEMTVVSVVDAIERDRIFYDESGGGVTFSGGEPLAQPAFLEALVEECRARGIHVAIDTSGVGDPAALERIWPDLFLFDLKAIDEERHRTITGASNNVILANLARVAARTRAGKAGGTGGASGTNARTRPTSPARPTRLVVRFPLIPGMSDADENVRDIGRTVSSLQIGRIDVLPYHRAGIAKYERLGRPYALPFINPPPPERVAHVVELLAEYGLIVRVGGA
jgi:pyruvate formate lyase activating enzyme